MLNLVSKKITSKLRYFFFKLSIIQCIFISKENIKSLIVSCLKNDQEAMILVEDVENLLYLSKSNQDIRLAIEAIKKMYQF
jgi:hypothetical protein